MKKLPPVKYRQLDGLPNLEALNIYDSSLYMESDALFRLKQVKSLMCSECRLNFEQKSAAENGVIEHLTLEQPYFSINNTSVTEVDQMMPYFAKLSALRSSLCKTAIWLLSNS
ncbi:hypothetical protein [Paenibacillus amylolyticus]|uniref:hypothetical protein n=1 Tax=Paenibacillus amylolyticus TaxID=1451 RepID=UPI003D9929E6